ncbi:MAG: hypothetical protein MK098_09840 [Marinovum sp.]|nr:hypothetical protein [Marinovum sp.]
MNDTQTKELPETQPEITLIAFDRKSFFLFDGEQHLNQLLLADGEFPKPVLCVHFASKFDASLTLGEDVGLGDLWGIHPEIIERLRDTDCLIETDG